MDICVHCGALIAPSEIHTAQFCEDGPNEIVHFLEGEMSQLIIDDYLREVDAFLGVK